MITLSRYFEDVYEFNPHVDTFKNIDDLQFALLNNEEKGVVKLSIEAGGLQSEWTVLADDIDKYIHTAYFPKALKPMFRKKAGDSQLLIQSVFNLLKANDRTYQKLFEAMVDSDYNPLWNVDGTVITERLANENYRQDSGTDTNNVTSGGAVGDGIGQLETRNILADAKTTTKNESAAYDSGGYKADSKSEVDTDGRTDKTQMDAQRTKSDTIYGKKEAENFKETVTRQGNIGVTKSSELLSDTWDLYDMHRFIQYVANDVMVLITMPFWDEGLEVL